MYILIISIFAVIMILSLVMYLILARADPPSSPTPSQIIPQQTSPPQIKAQNQDLRPTQNQNLSKSCRVCISPNRLIGGVKEGLCTKENTMDCPACPNQCPRFVHLLRERQDRYSGRTLEPIGQNPF